MRHKTDRLLRKGGHNHYSSSESDSDYFPSDEEFSANSFLQQTGDSDSDSDSDSPEGKKREEIKKTIRKSMVSLPPKNAITLETFTKKLNQMLKSQHNHEKPLVTIVKIELKDANSYGFGYPKRHIIWYKTLDEDTQTYPEESLSLYWVKYDRVIDNARNVKRNSINILSLIHI